MIRQSPPNDPEVIATRGRGIPAPTSFETLEAKFYLAICMTMHVVEPVA